MKPGPRVAMAVGLGYLLGRTRKMRLALMIAAAGASGRVGVGPRQLLQQGYKRLAASPELNKITDSLRGELLGAAKTAAMTAATNRIESLNSRLQDQVSVPGKRRRDDDAEQAEDIESEDEFQDEDEYDEDDYAEEEPEDEGTSGKRASSNGKPARAGSRRSPVRRARR